MEGAGDNEEVTCESPTPHPTVDIPVSFGDRIGDFTLQPFKTLDETNLQIVQTVK